MSGIGLGLHSKLGDEYEREGVQIMFCLALLCQKQSVHPSLHSKQLLWKNISEQKISTFLVALKKQNKNTTVWCSTHS